MGLSLSTGRPVWLSLRNRKVNSGSRWGQQSSPSFGIGLGSCHSISSLLMRHPLESIFWLSTQFRFCTPTHTNGLGFLILLDLSCKGYLSPGTLTQATAFFLSVSLLISKAVSSSISESQFPHLYNADCTSSKIYILINSFSIHGLNYSSPKMVFSFPPELHLSVFFALHHWPFAPNPASFPGPVDAVLP